MSPQSCRFAVSFNGSLIISVTVEYIPLINAIDFNFSINSLYLVYIPVFRND